MSRKSKIGLAVGLAALVVVGTGGKLVHELSQDTVNGLISCYGSAQTPIAWMCKKALVVKLRSAENVALLNKHGAARFPVMLSNEVAGREMLRILVSHGVDVNAVDQDSSARFTPLHLAAMDATLWQVELLLEHGADPDAIDASGMTPLDRARKVQQEYPDAGRTAIIQMLEARTSR